MKKLLLLLTGLLLSISSIKAQNPGELDLTFNPDGLNFGDGSNGIVYASVTQPDGKILIVGDFSSYNGIQRNRIARLNEDGSLDTSFNPGSGGNGGFSSIALQPDGKILVGGQFTSYDGISRNYISRLNADGSLDLSFNPGVGGNSIVRSVAIQPNGKILIGGYFPSSSGSNINGIARLNSDGTLDTSFNPGTGVDSDVQSIAIQSDGKILIWGRTGNFNSLFSRLNENGSLDTSFNPGIGANISIVSFVLLENGKILIGGEFTTYNGVSRNRLARLNGDGSLDTTFDPGTGANNSIRSMVLQQDGKILIGGTFNSFNGSTRNGIARLNPEGGIDNDFNPGTGINNSINSLSLQLDGKILIGGDFTSYNGVTRNRIARLNANGSLDTGFNPLSTGTNGAVFSVVLQPNEKVLIGGNFTSYNGTTRNRIARLNANGTLDAGFNPGTGTDNSVNSVILQPDGKILIGGNFTSYNETIINRIARLNPDGSLDTGFNPGTGANNSVFSVILLPDSKILIAGNFTSYNGTSINRIARLNADGSLDTGFNPGTGFNNSAFSMALQPDGKILIGGVFTSYNGILRNYITRLNADGTLDTSFDPGTVAILTVNAVAIQSDGKILIGGSFISVSSSTFHRIGRLNSDGSMDTSFIPGTAINNTVLSIVPQPDGKILIGGIFIAYGSTSRNRIARLNANGSLDSNFNPGSGVLGIVHSMSIQPDGKILIGGNFTQYNQVSRGGIARIYGDVLEVDNEAPAPDLDPLQTITAQCQVNFEDLTVPTATDAVNGNIQGSTDQSIFPITIQGPTTITWTYTDAAGNISSQNQTIIVDDITAPQIQAPANVTVTLSSGETVATGVQLGSPITSDNCGVEEVSNNAPLEYPVGLTEVIWTAKDVKGNESISIQTVLVNAPACGIQINARPSVTLTLNNKNVATLKVSDVNLGSSSSCGNITLSLSQTNFNCSDVGVKEVLFTVTDVNGNMATAIVLVTVLDVIAPKFAGLPKTITISLNEGDPYPIPDFSGFVTDNCGITSYSQSIPAGTVITTAGTYDVFIFAADTSGNAVSATVTIIRTVPKAKGGKSKRLIPGEPLVISVPWNTSFSEVDSNIEFDGNFQISWLAEDYNPLRPGLYQIKAAMTPEIKSKFKVVPVITILVQDKPIALDIELSNQKVVKNAGSGTVIGTLNTIDPVDDIHTYSMDPNPDLEIRGNQLIWKGINTPAAQMKFTVFSTDRAGQTISKDIVLTREVGPNQFILYPNPAQNETNIMVDLDEGAEVEIQVFDAVGRMVIEDTIYRGSTFIQTLDLNGLAPGMYMVQVKIGYIIMTERLIKR